jgi:DNA repair protein RecO (recombination protein O)
VVARTKIDGELAFVLHATPWRETSLVVDLLTERHGRIAAVAKGAKRANSAMRALQLSFQPLRVSWTGHTELRTLTKAEWQGGLAHPDGESLFCGFYLNELLVKLLHREDPHAAVFASYHATLERLTQVQTSLHREWALRYFEWHLLQQCGYAPDLQKDSAGKKVILDHLYYVAPGVGLVAQANSMRDSAAGYAESERVALTGEQIGQLASALKQGFLPPADDVIQYAKAAMRLLMSVPLEGKPLKTRKILRELQQISLD